MARLFRTRHRSRHRTVRPGLTPAPPIDPAPSTTTTEGPGVSGGALLTNDNDARDGETVGALNDAADKASISAGPGIAWTEAAGQVFRPPHREAPVSVDEVRSPNGEEVSTHLGTTSRITGKLRFEGSVLIEGQVEGQIETQESILIGEDAIVNANLMANSVVISGRVTGDVVSRRRVEIRSRGQLCGEVTTPSLIVHEGALFDGRCSVSGCPTSEKEGACAPTPHQNGTDTNHDNLKVKSEVEW